MFRDWYERQQRQRTTLKDSTSLGVAVIEYVDGEREMVDLRTEKFRNYRPEEHDACTTSDNERRRRSKNANENDRSDEEYDEKFF